MPDILAAFHKEIFRSLYFFNASSIFFSRIPFVKISRKTSDLFLYSSFAIASISSTNLRGIRTVIVFLYLSTLYTFVAFYIQKGTYAKVSACFYFCNFRY